MSIIVNGTTIPRSSSGNIVVNGTSVNKVVCNGVTVWERNSTAYIYTGSGSPFTASTQHSTSSDGGQLPSYVAYSGYADMGLSVGSLGKEGTIWVPVSIADRSTLYVDCEWISYTTGINPHAHADIVITNDASRQITGNNVSYNYIGFIASTTSVSRKTYSLSLANVSGSTLFIQMGCCNANATLRIYNIYMI